MGGSKKQTVGYKYYAGMHMVLCHGPIDNMSKIEVDEKLLWAGLATGADDLSSGWVRIVKQPMALFNSVKVGSTTFTFVSSGASGNEVLIGATTEATAANLAAKINGISGVTSSASGSYAHIESASNLSLSVTNVFLASGRLSVSGSKLSGAGGRLSINKPSLFGGDSREGGITGELDFLTGHDAQEPNDYLVSKLGSLVPAFRGVVSVVLRQMNLSMNPYLKTWSFLVQRIHLQQDGSPQWEDAYSQIDVPVTDENGNPTTAAAMNPAHIIRECLTNKLWGMGYNEGDIDDDAFLAAAITLHGEKMGMALLWDTQTSIEEFVKISLQHIDASLYVDRKTGKFTLKLIRGGYDEDDLLVLDPSNIDKIEDFKRPVFGELANSITVNYWDFSSNATGSVTVQDIALAQEQGGDINTTVTYEGFIDAATASKVAQRDLRSLSTPLISCTVYATKVARDLNIGDVFVMSWPDYQIQSVVMRITGIAYGDGKTRRVRIQCAQDVFSYPEDAFVSKPPSGWVEPIGEPGPVLFRGAYEAPYFELVRDNGQTAVDNAIETNPYIAYVIGACSTPLVTSINAIMQSNDGSGYEEVAQVDFCAGAFLNEAIDQMQTVFEITGGESLTLVEGGVEEWVQMGTELMGVVSLDGSTLTVKRGVLDTVPVAHNAGESLLFWDGFAANDPTEYVASDTVFVKFQAVNGAGIYDLDDASEIEVPIVGRAAKPFAPGKVQVNGSFFPTVEQSGDIVFTWVPRNRVLQTGGTLVGFVDDALTPEDDTLYNVVIEDSNEDLVESSLDLDALTYTVAEEVVETVYPYFVFNLEATRNGLTSYQGHRIKVNVVNPSIGVTGYEVTIASGTVGSDLTDFPLMVDLSLMPPSFWAGVNETGGNLRAYAANGSTQRALDVTFVDKELERGRAFVKTDILAASDTTIIISIDDVETDPVAVGSSIGRNAVWADYEAVYVFPSTDNRTGNAYTQDISDVETQSTWTRTGYYGSLAGAPHQGIATDGAGTFVTIDTNYLRKYSGGIGGTVSAVNSDPIAASGIALVGHLGDGCIVGTELFLPLEEYPNSPYDNQHIVVYNLSDLTFNRSYDISAQAHEASSIAYDGTYLYITDYTVYTKIHKYSTTGVYQGAITLSTPLTRMQGIEVVNGKFLITLLDRSVYEVEFDGTVNGVVLHNYHNGDGEGLCYDGTRLYLLEIDGDLSIWEQDKHADYGRFHYSDATVDIPFATTWTVGASVFTTAEDDQNAYLGVANGTSSSNSAALLYDDGPDRFDSWNSSNSWLAPSPGVNPGAYEDYRIVLAHDGATARKLVIDGVLSKEQLGITARPAGTATDMNFVINGSRPNAEVGECYYQNVWLRAEYMGTDWLKADGDNNSDPASFYTITEVF